MEPGFLLDMEPGFEFFVLLDKELGSEFVVLLDLLTDSLSPCKKSSSNFKKENPVFSEKRNFKVVFDLRNNLRHSFGNLF